jgi:hypothetical protein
MPRVFPLVALCVALGCKKPAPPAPARFCDQDLSGLWLNSSDPHLAYRFRDHGDVIRGEFLERQEDGGLQAPDEPILFELHRADASVAGVMRTQGPSRGGRICPVEYGTSVTDCKPDALQVTVEMSVNIGDDCKRVRLEDGGEPPPNLAEFRFERSSAGREMRDGG